jgi:hypothetical protein
MMTSQAREFTGRWLEMLLAGDRYRTLVWTLHPAQRPPKHVDLDQYFNDPQNQQRVHDFFIERPAIDLIGQRQARCTYLGSAGVSGNRRDCYLSLRFAVDWSNATAGNRQPMEITVVTRRMAGMGDDQIEWQISSVHLE